MLTPHKVLEERMLHRATVRASADAITILVITALRDIPPVLQGPVLAMLLTEIQVASRKGE